MVTTMMATPFVWNDLVAPVVDEGATEAVATVAAVVMVVAIQEATEAVTTEDQAVGEVVARRTDALSTELLCQVG